MTVYIVKTHQTVHSLKWFFTLCKLPLNKTDKIKHLRSSNCLPSIGQTLFSQSLWSLSNLLCRVPRPALDSAPRRGWDMQKLVQRSCPSRHLSSVSLHTVQLSDCRPQLRGCSAAWFPNVWSPDQQAQITGWEPRGTGGAMLEMQDLTPQLGLPDGSAGKESARNAGDAGSIPGPGRSLEEENGNPFQYSCLKKSHGRGSLVGYSPWSHK